MRTSAQIESLIRKNVLACETAKRHKCNCACEGKFHRKPHPEEWLEGVIQDAIDEQGGDDA